VSTTQAHVEEWSGEDVGIGAIEGALTRLREASAKDSEGPDLRTSVMTHLAWVPAEWEEAALETFSGLGERHPSRGILLFPQPDEPDGLDARVSVLAFPHGVERRHVAAEVVELRLRGSRAHAPASIVVPLLVTGVPVFLRWRGRPQFGRPEVDQMIELCDRLIVHSGEWPDVPEAYAELPFDRTAVSDIAWRRSEPWRRCLSSLWPDIAELAELRVTGPVAEASLLAGWLRSRLGRDVKLVHEDAEELESVSADGAACPVPHDEPSASDLLSAELDEFGRDPVYEAAAARAAA
jgi:hypothetical protein